MTCSAINKADDHYCGGCGATLPGVSVSPGAEAPRATPAVRVPPVQLNPIPSVARRPPPPAPSPKPHKRTVTIETVSDLIIEEQIAEQPIG